MNVSLESVAIEADHAADQSDVTIEPQGATAEEMARLTQVAKPAEVSAEAETSHTEEAEEGPWVPFMDPVDTEHGPRAKVALWGAGCLECAALSPELDPESDGTENPCHYSHVNAKGKSNKHCPALGLVIEFVGPRIRAQAQTNRVISAAQKALAEAKSSTDRLGVVADIVKQIAGMDN